MTLPFANEPTFSGTVNVATSVKFGKRCKVWQFATLCHDVELGDDVVIGSNVWVGAGTKIGSGTRIQHGAFIPKGSCIGKNVFIGPNVTMTDDKYPKVGAEYEPRPPRLHDNCSIGAGAVLLPGVNIGTNVLVGAGSVVTKDVFEDQVIYNLIQPVRVPNGPLS